MKNDNPPTTPGVERVETNFPSLLLGPQREHLKRDGAPSPLGPSSLEHLMDYSPPCHLYTRTYRGLPGKPGYRTTPLTPSREHLKHDGADGAPSPPGPPFDGLWPNTFVYKPGCTRVCQRNQVAGRPPWTHTLEHLKPPIGAF